MALRKYGNLYFEKNTNIWKIDNAEPHISIKLKAIFNKIAKGQPQPYKFNNTPEVCSDLLWFTQRYPLNISDEDLKLLNRQQEAYINNINELEAILLPDYKPLKLELKKPYEARNYQLTGKDVYLKNKRLLIGDDIGLGKTLTGILSCLHPETLPCAIVVQTHMTTQWKEQIEKYTNLKVHIIKGTKPYSLPTADLFIFKYSCLSGWINIFEKKFFKSCIFDEVQELRHNSTMKYIAAETISKSCDYCLGLSASPVYNYGDEIFNVLNIIKKDCLGGRNDFLREWTGGGKVVREPKALGTYLRDNFLMLRRTRKDVGRELPVINKIIHTVGYDESEVQKSEELAKKLAITVTTSTSFVERGQAAQELNILVRHTTGVSKARYIAEYVKILLDNNEPIVLAAWHRDVYEILLEELKQYKPVLYTGSESSAQKEKSKQAFLNGETNLFIISLRSGVGLDGLQNISNIVVIAELDWSPKIHDQLIGRLDRDGQTKQVTAIYLVSEYGSDPLIIDMLGLKSSQSHGIIDPLIAVQDQYSDESRIKLLAQRFLSKKHD